MEMAARKPPAKRRASERSPSPESPPSRLPAADEPLAAPAALTREERRARREARRQEQRAANVGRAEKMHAARLAWEESAAEPQRAEVAKGKAMVCHIGCSGWYYWHWQGGFYPR